MNVSSSNGIKPRLIIHGGAGLITRKNLSPESYRLHRRALLRIVREAWKELNETPNSSDAASPSSSSSSSERASPAVRVATLAVKRMEDCPLFNSGKGAVFNSSGKNELEASVMIAPGAVGLDGSKRTAAVGGASKRSAAVSLLGRVRNPILLAREMLLRGDEDMLPDRNGKIPLNDTSAHGHCHLSGAEAERLATAWGMDMVDPAYFWTKKRWEQHRDGLSKRDCADKQQQQQQQQQHVSSCVTAERGVGRAGLEHPPEWEAELREEERFMDQGWDGIEYVPQGTVGAVALDASGTLCAATSTGGITNKSAGRIGDTPTAGAGYWAEMFQGEEDCDDDHDHDETSEHSGAPDDSCWIGARDEPSGPQDGATITKAADFSILPDISLSPLGSALKSCLPLAQRFLFAGPADSSPATTIKSLPPPAAQTSLQRKTKKNQTPTRALALSGTGNGDSFIRCCAAHNVAMRAFLSPSSSSSFSSAGSVSPSSSPSSSSFLTGPARQVAGPGGVLQRNAGSRWGKGTLEGYGGVIGIGVQYVAGETKTEKGSRPEVAEVGGEVVAEFNCPGMYRAWIDDEEEAHMMIFKEEY